MRKSWHLITTFVIAALALATPVWAQDTPAVEGEAEPIQGKVGVISEDDAPKSNDPADVVVQHIVAMTSIVRDQMDKPEEVKSKLEAYIDENGDAMQTAGEEFEARLEALPADERQAYKEKLQRKMESALADFFEVMLDFSERHPDAAKELDEMLQKVATN